MIRYSHEYEYKPFFPKTKQYDVGWRFCCFMSGMATGSLIPVGLGAANVINSIGLFFILMPICFLIPFVIYLGQWNIRHIPHNIRVKKYRNKVDAEQRAFALAKNNAKINAEAMSFIDMVRSK